ncbi:hypothetical protein H7S55_25605 [Priestia aryabhattai]|uniref:hypothetical protein n=1 Tax=Priestia aryabhattai TaxID=412384 RepID=UPI001C8DBC84|nr:hypothetical protein [Priestia aryabhattai]MBY0003521.1 hypothetical protein [Priestia aryabhattai]
MDILELISKIVSLAEAVNKLSELVDMDKLPSWVFLVGVNLNFRSQRKVEDKDQEDKQKKEPS